MSNESPSKIGNRQSAMQTRLLYLFTRTPLHVGAGDSVGPIDQPIIRERHTGFPIIPASSLKGTFADAWDAELEQEGKKFLRVTAKKNEMDQYVPDEMKDAAWLFGSNNDKVAFTGALQFCEARLLAFPIRSAKGSFAWITCPLILERASRDGVVNKTLVPQFPKPAAGQLDQCDEHAFFAANGPLALGNKIVLEEYTFTHTGELPEGLAAALAQLLTDDPVWQEVTSRLVVLSDGMMSFFAQNACEVAQHVRISDETGTAEGGALFNQENVPSETLFYSILHAFDERTANKANGERRKANEAINAFQGKDKEGHDQSDKPGVRDGSVFQFGGDASTGLGYCTVKLNGVKGA
ncbi:MAG TPA: type III-B CRISPR module RAMP protein Cmr4 [Verrucomicrobiota bacterium]|nr:type III-B CRISPR module RAMP protein Cmr4 [Verrucomicrobiota bacterium]